MLALAIVAGCSDSPTTPLKPASIQIAVGDKQSGIVGQKLVIAPSFIVNDASGKPLSGVGVSVAVTAGGGAIADAPSKSGSGATSAGTWTLGPRVGANTITVTVDGLAPIVFSATAAAGAPAKITASTSTAIAARVGAVVSPTPSVRVTDAFDNPIASATLNVSLTGGGSAATSVVTDANGLATIPVWQLGTVPGQSVLTVAAGSATLHFVATIAPGDPAHLIVNGADQRGRAGVAVAPITVSVTDEYGNAIGNQSATFTVTTGGGTLAAMAAVSAAGGAIVVPTWTLGRTALPQSMHVTSGVLATDITVAVATDYKIDVRFYGPDMTAEQKAWFTNAAARISAIVTGDIPDVAVANLDVAAACGISGLPTMNETIDDLVIYASVTPIDGPGKILAQAGPCVQRSAASGSFSAVGVMQFDAADMDKMAAQGITQEVITHEMLHVVGVGTLWQDKSLITAAGTALVAYWGALGKQGCIDDGGAATCASSVPVENNGVRGTADAHWRESTFGNEMMTGYANVGGMPLSAITAGSLGDLGYTVNLFAADPFQIPGTGSGASGNRVPRANTAEQWETLPPAGVVLGAKPGEVPVFIRRAPK